jgi:hypothetical protein
MAIGSPQFCPQTLDGVDLHDDPLFEVRADVQTQIFVCRTGEAVHTGMTATPIAINGVPEGHDALRGHGVDDRAGVDVEKFQPGVGPLAHVACGVALVSEEGLARFLVGQSPAQCHGPTLANICSLLKESSVPRIRQGRK